MPYELRGNKVVKSSTGEVVKDHGSDHAKAVRHLRALKANVEEAAPAVLGVLLEGFNPGEARGFHGRWVKGRGGKPGRIEGTYHGVKLERGVAYQGRLATGEIHTGVWNGKVTGRGVDDPHAHPEFRHVDTGAVRTFHGGEFFGRLSDVRVPGQSARVQGIQHAAEVRKGLQSPRVRAIQRAAQARKLGESDVLGALLGG